MLSIIAPLSAMRAASTRVEAAASNIANMRSDGALPSSSLTSVPGAIHAYQPVQVEQSSTAGGGTAAVVRNVTPSYLAMYDPTASYADEQGMVATPNVDELTQMVDFVTAKGDFELNAKIVQSINDMVKKLYDLGE